MTKKILLQILLLLVLVPVAASASGPKGIQSPSFWIGRLENPDSVVLRPKEIGELDRAIIEGTDQMADVAAMPDAVPGLKLREWLLFDPVPTPEEPRFTSGGELVKRPFFDALARNMDIKSVLDENPVKFGVVVEHADVRAFPTDTALLKRPGAFDTVQYSNISPMEPVALLHRSADGKWGFFQTRFARGWIRLEKVAFTDRAGLEPMRARHGGLYDGFIVVTGSHADAYPNRSLNGRVVRFPMGSVLYLSGRPSTGRPFLVSLPERTPEGALSWKRGYLAPGADVNRGFLPYTRANVIRQAFKMLSEEYGWGGKGGLRDCSAFVKDVFASFGVQLPRNSSQQSVVGRIKLGLDEAWADVQTDGQREAQRASALKGADPGVTLFGIDGHIMLYLGTLNGKPYVIHQIWGYMDGTTLKELGKVSVTGLELGARSELGSLSHRIRSVTEVKLPSVRAVRGGPNGL